MDVGVWLRSLGLGQYEAAFRDNEIEREAGRARRRKVHRPSSASRHRLGPQPASAAALGPARALDWLPPRSHSGSQWLPSL